MPQISYNKSNPKQEAGSVTGVPCIYHYRNRPKQEACALQAVGCKGSCWQRRAPTTTEATPNQTPKQEACAVRAVGCIGSCRQPIHPDRNQRAKRL